VFDHFYSVAKRAPPLRTLREPAFLAQRLCRTPREYRSIANAFLITTLVASRRWGVKSNAIKAVHE
jgi:hypothetical protein